MLTPDPSSARAFSGRRDDVDALLSELAAGRGPATSTALPDALLNDLAEVLTGASGQVELTLSTPQGLSSHTLTLARAGTLRRSRGLTDREDLALHPTSTLPGVLLRLAGIAPTEALRAGEILAPPTGSCEEVFSDRSPQRETAWAQLREVAAALPPAAEEQIDQAPPRGLRLVRRRASGDRTAVVLLLRGRYLVAETGGAAALRGTTPTGATRALLRPLLSASG